MYMILSDTPRSVEQTTAIMGTRAHMQVHGKASPCSHPTDHRDRWTHRLKINLVQITFSHIP